MAKYGRAALRWTPDSTEPITDRVLLLDVPLHNITPGHSLATWYAESMDRSKNATITVGTGAYELQGEVRYASNPTGLLDVIKAGSQGKTLTYVPDVADPAVQESVILISPRSPADVALDADRGFRGEAQVTLRFRRTDQKASPTRSYGSDVLFAYHAGDSLSAATFSRTTGATYPGVASTADFGYGTVTTAAANASRIGWYSSRSSVGPRTIPALLLEPARTNLVTESYGFNSTGWTRTAITVTTGQADPFGGTKASLLADSTAISNGRLKGRDIAVTSTYAAMSFFCKQGTTQNSSGSWISLQNAVSADVIRAVVTWSSGVPTVAWTVGAEAAPPERWRAGWYRLAGRTTAALASSVSYRANVYPAIGGGGIGNIYLFGVQVEQ